jgi:hypothetical protein
MCSKIDCGNLKLNPQAADETPRAKLGERHDAHPIAPSNARYGNCGKVHHVCGRNGAVWAIGLPFGEVICGIAQEWSDYWQG